MTEVDLTAAADDFKLITGIGPAIERHLREANILTYEQLASLSPEEAAEIMTGVNGMSAERISKQDWVGQASALAVASFSSKRPPVSMTSGNHQHYATFKVELLLDEENEVRRTQVVYVQGGNEETWAGWQEKQLVDFITKQAALTVEPAVPETTTETPASHTTAVAPVTKVEALHVRQLDVLTAQGPQQILRKDTPFNIQLSFDLSDVSLPKDAPLDYSALVYAKSLGSGMSEATLIGRTQGKLTEAKSNIHVSGTQLIPGIYRLQAEMSLTIPGQPLLNATKKGDLLQIF